MSARRRVHNALFDASMAQHHKNKAIMEELIGAARAQPTGGVRKSELQPDKRHGTNRSPIVYHHGGIKLQAARAHWVFSNYGIIAFARAVHQTFMKVKRFTKTTVLWQSFIFNQQN